MSPTARHVIFLGFILARFAQSLLIVPLDSDFWPNATVFYSNDGSFDNSENYIIGAAIADYHSKTCIRWVPRSSQPAYVNFIKSNEPECACADNCYTGMQQTAKFHQTCMTLPTVVREMGHALCFGPEQNRNDRDNFLAEHAGCPDKNNHLNGGHLYDYKSVMHDKCGDACTTPIQSGIMSCGNDGGGLSVLDAEKLNDMYKCGGCFAYRFKFPEQINRTEDNPVVAGSDRGLVVYACRVYFNGDIIPGKALLGASPACWVPYNGREYQLNAGFEVLTNPGNEANLLWTPDGPLSSIPQNAIAGGKTASGEALYVARCQHDIGGGQRIFIPGTVFKNSPEKMYYSYGTRGYECKNYQLLVCGFGRSSSQSHGMSPASLITPY